MNQDKPEADINLANVIQAPNSESVSKLDLNSQWTLEVLNSTSPDGKKLLN